MTPQLLTALAFALLAAPHLLPGQQKHQVFSFDLDVPGGNFSEWALETPDGIAGVSGTIVFKTLRPKPPWMPSFAVVVGDSNGSVSLSFAQRTKKGPLLARLRGYEHGELKQSEEFPGSYAPGDTVTFTLSWASDGTVTALFQGDTIAGLHMSPPRRVSIAASSGQVKATRLVYLSRE